MTTPKPLYISKTFKTLNDKHVQPIEFDKTKTIIQYFSSAKRCWDEAVKADAAKDEERAYVLFNRYINTYKMLKSNFPSHHKEIHANFTYLGPTMDHLERLSVSLKSRYAEEKGRREAAKAMGDNEQVNKDEHSSDVSSGLAKSPDVISSNDFYQLIKNKLSILVLDVREENDYELSHVYLTSQINIPASFLSKQGVVTSGTLDDVLANDCFDLWRNRSSFDNVILIDWFGSQETFSKQSEPLTILRDCLVKWSPENTLKCSPRILCGGYCEFLELYPTLTTNSKAERPSRKKEEKPLIDISKLTINKLSVAGEVVPNDRIEDGMNGDLKHQEDIKTRLPKFDRSTKPSLKLNSDKTAQSKSLSTGRAGSELYPSIGDISSLSSLTSQPLTPKLSITNGSMSTSKDSLDSLESLTARTVIPPPVDRKLKPTLSRDSNSDLNVVQLNDLSSGPNSLPDLNSELENKRQLDQEEKDRIRNEELARLREERRAKDELEKQKELERAEIERKRMEKENEELERRRMMKIADDEKGRLDAVKNELEEAKKREDELQRLRMLKNDENMRPKTAAAMRDARVENQHNLEKKDSFSTNRTLKRTNSSPNLNKLVQDISNAEKGKPQSVTSNQRIVNPKPSLAKLNSHKLVSLQPEYGSAGRGLCGLRNLGNSCYMNSILQCLSHTSLINSYFLYGIFGYHVNANNKEGMGGLIAKEFSLLLQALWAGQYSNLAPVDFKRAIATKNKQFAGTDQQDSQEFLTCILDALHEDLNKVNQKKAAEVTDAMMKDKTDAQLATLFWEKYLLNNQSIIVDMFQGQYRSIVECLTCKEHSSTFDTFMYLSLPVPTNKKSCTLQDCFDLYTAAETIEWMCPKCKRLRNSRKKLDIWKYPRFLIIHLKRFEYNMSSLLREKIQTNVQFPIKRMSLESLTAEKDGKHPFDLYGVSYHYGTIDGGHYIARVWVEEKKSWFTFDDAVVNMCSPDKIVANAAYILFYSNYPMTPPTPR